MANESLLWSLGLKNGDFKDKINESIGLVRDFALKMNLAFEVVKGGFLLAFLDKVVDHAGQIRDTADALHVTTDSLQGLDFVSKQAGVSVEILHNSLGILESKSSAAASGNKQVSDALNKLGISASDFVKLPVDRQLEAIAKGAASAKDQGEAFSALVELLGERNAPRLNAVLKELADQGLAGTTEAARQMGQVLDDSTISSLDDLGDRLEAVKTAGLNVGAVLLNLSLRAAEAIGSGNTSGIASWVADWRAGSDAIKGASNNVDGYASRVENLNLVLKGTKATTEEITKAQEAQAKAQETSQLAGLGNLQKIEFLRNKISVLLDQEATYAAGTRESLKLQGDLTELALKLRAELVTQSETIKKNTEATADAAKADKDAAMALLPLVDQRMALLVNIAILTAQIADGEKKHLDVTTQIKEAEEDRSKLRTVEAEQAKNEVEIATLLLKGKGNLNDVEKERLSLLMGETTETKEHAELHSLLAKGVENLTDKERTRLMTLTGQTAEIKNQVQQVVALSDAWDNFSFSAGIGGSALGGQSTSALLGLADRLRAQIDAADHAPLETNVGGSSPRSLTSLIDKASNQMALQQVEEELTMRQTVLGSIQKYGEDQARSIFGDAATNEAMRDMQDSSTRTATALETLVSGLNQSGIIKT